MAFFIFVHPLAASIAVLLCLTNAYLGISRIMIYRGSESRFFRFNRSLHVKVGLGFIVLLYIIFPFGIAGIIESGAPAFSTPHAYLGTLLLLIFGTGTYFAFKVLRGRLDYVKLHGRIMVLGAALILLQVLGGVANLRALGII
jgi:hypothetical protein